MVGHLEVGNAKSALWKVPGGRRRVAHDPGILAYQIDTQTAEFIIPQNNCWEIPIAENQSLVRWAVLASYW